MKNAKGSTIGLVLICTLAIAIVVTGVVSLVNFQRKMSVRRELQFQANNVAETAMDYAFAYVANDVKRTSVSATDYIPTGSTKYKEFDFSDEAKSFLTGAVGGPASYTDSTSQVQFSDVSVRVLQRGDAQHFTVQRSVSGNRLSDLDGQIVFETAVPVVARVKATHRAYPDQAFTAYIQKQMAFDEVPMFQKAITYQGQLHLHRGYPILGGVHTNGNLAINAQDGDNAVYNGLVTCAGRFYRGSAFDVGGTGADPYGYCPENAAMEFDFRKIYTENISLAATNTKSLKIITSDPTDAKVTATYAQLATDFDSRKSDWKTQALTLFKGNLLDKSHEVSVMLPPGCSQYRLDDAQTAGVNEFTNGTYVLLHPNITDKTHPAYNPDNIYQFARKATLLFRVECLAKYKGTTSATSGTPPVTTADTTEKTYKWIIKAYKKYADDQDDANWVPLPLPPGVIGQTKVQTWTPSDAPNAQYEIATNVIDPTVVAGAVAANPYLQGLFEEYKIGGSPYVINNGGVTVTSVATVSDATGDWPCASATGLGPLQTAGLVTGFLLPYRYDTSTTKYVGGYNVKDGPANKPNLIEDTTTASTKSGNIDPVQQAPGHGFFDARLGRGVSPITINMKALKDVLDGTDSSSIANTFRTLLGVGGDDYNGLIYVEFPTSLETVATVSKRCYQPSTTTPYPGDMSAVDSYAFAVGGSAALETRHPDRMSETDSRATRTDNILPIAKSLRGYPASYSDSEIAKPQWAIPALVIVNGKQLPTITGVTGLTIATNAPMYLIGSYNSDGNFATGTNITGTKPTDYAVDDPGWGEVSAGLFSDTLTILSDTWGKPGSATMGSKTYVDGQSSIRFKYSFGGGTNYSTSNRKVVDGQVEISACILTGEYPIFEFFLHALEDWGNYYNKGGTSVSPICIKGAVVGMFHSEIQHIKGAYGRNVNSDIQTFYTGHGAFAIPAVRIHKRLMNGIFPPGTPMARDYGQKAFQFLRPSSVADKVTLSDAGF